jgi:hypothetical protein
LCDALRFVASGSGGDDDADVGGGNHGNRLQVAGCE